MTETRNEYIDNLAKVWMSTVAGGVIICLIGAAAIIVPAFFTLAITWLIGIGALIVSASADRNLRIWAAATGAEQTILSGHTLGVNACAFSPDGTLVASASDGPK